MLKAGVGRHIAEPGFLEGNCKRGSRGGHMTACHCPHVHPGLPVATGLLDADTPVPT